MNHMCILFDIILYNITLWHCMYVCIYIYIQTHQISPVFIRSPPFVMVGFLGAVSIPSCWFNFPSTG